MGSTHPMIDMRVSKLKNELVRWELERRVAISRRAIENTADDGGMRLSIV
jgi:hypothetical protein